LALVLTDEGELEDAMRVVEEAQKRAGV
jgi:hypothetical protein